MTALHLWLIALSAVASSCAAGLWWLLCREREEWRVRSAFQAARITDLTQRLAAKPRMAARRRPDVVGDEVWADLVARLREPADPREAP